MKAFLRASVPGALAGFFYGIVEYSLLIVRPMVVWRPQALPAEHWKWEALFLALYVGLGCVVGGLVGLIRKSPSPRPGKWTAIVGGGAAVAAAVLITATLFLNAAPAFPKTRSVAGQHRPNILLIVLDTVRADHLSVYGYGRRTTPHLEALARSSVLYRNAVSTSDLTLSSHASIFTGLYSSWHGAHATPSTDLRPLAPSFHTMAEILSENGYATFAVLANDGYLRPEFGLDQGFGFYDVRPPVKTLGGGSHHYPRNVIAGALKHIAPTYELERPYRRGDQITDGALRILNHSGKDAPFFLTLNYMDAHEPYMPPAAYRDLFPGRDPNFKDERLGELRRQLAARQHPPDMDAVLRHVISQYDGGIAFMDAELQRLFDGMKRAGVYDNTLIVITSDHGEAFGQWFDLGHPASVHQGLVHIPLMIKYPAGDPEAAGESVAANASLADLLPTVLESARIPVPSAIQGRSLRTAASGDRAVISESFLDNHLVRIHRRTDLVERAVYYGPWKLIASTSGRKELYNLRQDPQETRNLYSPSNARAQQLATALDQWVEDIPRQKSSPKMDHETLERLRSLGYVQ